MAKRFFDTSRIDEDWYINLSLKHRELLRYCESKCDGAGVFSFNEKIASTYIGEKITSKDLDLLPIEKLKTGRYLIQGFCKLQNGELSRKSPAHNPIFKSIEENGIDIENLYKGLYDRLSNSLLVIEKEIVIEKVKEKEIDLTLPFLSESFIKVWNVLKNEPKWKKKTPAALQASLKQLSNYSEKEAIEMMERSIAGGWQGLFEQKKQNEKRNHQPDTADAVAWAINTLQNGNNTGMP